MKVQLSMGLGRPFKTVVVRKGTDLRQIHEKYRIEGDLEAYAANVYNDIKPLNYKIHMDTTVQFLDIRTKSAFMVYQYSLAFLFLKAAHDVLGEDDVQVRTTLVDGLFITVGDRKLRKSDITRLEKYMSDYVERDVPIESNGFEHTLDGFTRGFYIFLVPSTGYLRRFELMQYHEGVLLRYPQPELPEEIPEFIDEPVIYDAYEEQTAWNKLLGIEFFSDINKKILSGGAKELIQLSEALHDKKIVDIANTITDQKKRIILILGPSSSGKTTTAKRLAIQLKVNGLDPFYVSTDDYFLEREQTPKDAEGNYNFEGIDALDLDLFNNQMNGLLAGEEVDIPVFDFCEGKKVFGTRLTKLNKNQPIIIEGIHAFNDKLTGKIQDKQKYRIYISPLTQVNLDPYNRIPTTDARLIRRLVRDSRTRGYDAINTLKRWPKVHEGECMNIFPVSSKADVFFNTVHVYETAVLKKYAVPLLEEVPRDVPEYAEAHRLLRFFEGVVDIDDESLIAGDSILREFIGGSTYDK